MHDAPEMPGLITEDNCELLEVQKDAAISHPEPLLFHFHGSFLG